MREADLADCGGGLAFLQPQRALGQTEMTPAQGDRARGNEDDLLTAPAQPQQILDQRLEPGAVKSSGVLIHE